MRCPVCNKRMGRSVYHDQLACPGCGYCEPPEDLVHEPVVPTERRTVPMKGAAKGKPRASSKAAKASAKKKSAKKGAGDA